MSRVQKKRKYFSSIERGTSLERNTRSRALLLLAFRLNVMRTKYLDVSVVSMQFVETLNQKDCLKLRNYTYAYICTMFPVCCHSTCSQTMALHFTVFYVKMRRNLENREIVYSLNLVFITVRFLM